MFYNFEYSYIGYIIYLFNYIIVIYAIQPIYLSIYLSIYLNVFNFSNTSHKFCNNNLSILQTFNRNAEQLEQWMATREAIIQSEDVGAAEGAEALIKKHEDFTKTLAVQDVKINALNDEAKRLIDNDHYDSPAIAERISTVLAR